jgi:hypothetical protein
MSSDQTIQARRERVAQLLLRGLTQREIVQTLDNQGIRNRETGKPYSLGTINNDVAALENQWLEDVKEATGRRKARVTQEIYQVRRKAWANGDMDAVLKGLGMEIGLYGLNEPNRHQLSGNMDVNVSGELDVNHHLQIDYSFIMEMSEEERELFIANTAMSLGSGPISAGGGAGEEDAIEVEFHETGAAPT